MMLPQSRKPAHTRSGQMKKVILSVAVSLFAASLAPAAFAVGTQQNKMKECNASATDKKGDERKAFMKECLSAKPAPSPKTAQQEKMKSCNKEAGEKALKGDERKKFMSSCLKG
jgi:uncharacterized protein HemX